MAGHVAAQGRVRGQGPQGLVRLDQDLEIVPMQRHAPARVLPVLSVDRLGEPGADRHEAAPVPTRLAGERRDRISGRAGGVVPAFDRRDREAPRLAGHRMRPGRLRQSDELAAQLCRGGRRSQQAADDQESEAGPAVGRGSGLHQLLLSRRRSFGGRGRSYGYLQRPARRILCGSWAILIEPARQDPATDQDPTAT